MNAAYWERRHQIRMGKWRANGAGSKGKLAARKVGAVNGLIETVGAETLLDVGCGDGALAMKFKVHSYLGIDCSPTAVSVAERRFEGRKRWGTATLTPTLQIPKCDVAISLDVIFHLLDQADYEEHLAILFRHASKAVGIYSSDHNSVASGHVRHRRFIGDVVRRFPGWDLRQLVPPRWPTSRFPKGSDCFWTVWRPSK